MELVNKVVVVLGMLMLIVCLLGACDARMPQKGDHVMLSVTFGSSVLTYNGNITDIGNELIVINATDAYLSGSTMYDWIPKDIAIGIGSIVSLTWLK